MRKKKKRGQPFAPIFRDVIAKEEWKSLTKSEKIIYIYLKARYNGSNNGQISLKYKELDGEFSDTTISNVFKGLEKKGWVEKTKYGGLHRNYCLYKLTLRYDRVFKMG